MADDPSSARPPGAPPQPVRPASAPLQARPDVGAAERGTEQDGGRSSTPPLTSARAMARTEAPSSPTTPDLEEAEFDADSRRWVVRVLGRTVGAGVVIAIAE